MKYEILQKVNGPRVVIEKGTVKEEIDWLVYFFITRADLSNPAWFREVSGLKVGDIMLSPQGACRITEIDNNKRFPIRVVSADGRIDGYMLDSPVLTPAPPIPDKLELCGVKYKVKMKNGVPEYVSEYEAIPAEARYFCIACEEVHPKFGTHIGDFNGAYILSPVEERFTLERGNVMEGWQVDNVNEIEAAIRDIYDRIKGVGR